MRFCFRVDASIQIGSGHVIRCLTVANRLKENGHESYFICRRHQGDLIEFIQQRGYIVYILDESKYDNSDFFDEYQQWLGVTEQKDAQDSLRVLKTNSADWLVVDHYGLSCKWQEIIRQQNPDIRIVVIDDLANRCHDADIILDCGLMNTQEDYERLNARKAIYLIGSHYALLRPEFHQKRLKLEQCPRSHQLSEKIKILLNLGGVDKDNLTGLILNQLNKSNQIDHFDVTVVMGLNAPHKDSVIQQVKTLVLNGNVLINVDNMSDLMMEHDIAIGAAGSTAWERCCLGLPTVMICMADNQKMIAKSLQDIGAAVSLDQSEIESKLLDSLYAVQLQLREMQQKAFLVTDGQGVELLLKYILDGD